MILAYRRDLSLYLYLLFALRDSHDSLRQIYLDDLSFFLLSIFITKFN